MSGHVPLPQLYRATLLSGFAECRREWVVLGNADSAPALLFDREFGSHINPVTDIPLRVSLAEKACKLSGRAKERFNLPAGTRRG